MTTHALPYASPLEFAPLRAVLAAHAGPGVESVAAHGVRRTVPVDGHLARVTVDWSAAQSSRQSSSGAARIELTVDGAPRRCTDRIVHTVRCWLDLDADPDRRRRVFQDDPVLGPLVQERPGLRILGSADPWETAAGTVLGQQVSLAGARTLTGRLAATFGRRSGTDVAFPRPEDVVEAPLEDLRAAVGVPLARATAVRTLAEAVLDGSVALAHPSGPEFRERLTSLRGIGPWTAEYLALRLGDRDACPTGDLVLRRALGAASEAEVRRATRSWAPVRAGAVFHLWTRDSFADTSARTASRPVTSRSRHGAVSGNPPRPPRRAL